MSARTARIAELWRLVRVARRMIVGRRSWWVPLVPLLWIGFQGLRQVVPNWAEGAFVAADVQGLLIGAPLALLASFLGVRIIAGEIDRRTLEITYTVPGGAHRVWLAKLAASAWILVLAWAAMAIPTHVFLAPVTVGAMYGALQAALFYLALSALFGALTRGETSGAMLTTGVLVLNWFVQAAAAGGQQIRISPFFNPLLFTRLEPPELVARTVQNRIGFALAIATLVVLAIRRAERRERLLS